jgi:plastocyanin
VVLFGVLAGLLGACGPSTVVSSPALIPSGQGFYITISGSAYSPVDLHVPAGATVTVINRDAMLHSVTSETAPNAFAPGSVGGIAFDTGQFTGTRTFSIPPAAVTSTVVPYYCSAHLGAMATPNGSITIDPTAVPTGGP